MALDHLAMLRVTDVRVAQVVDLLAGGAYFGQLLSQSLKPFASSNMVNVTSNPQAIAVVRLW
jgi:predicted methyltransferase